MVKALQSKPRSPKLNRRVAMPFSKAGKAPPPPARRSRRAPTAQLQASRVAGKRRSLPGAERLEMGEGLLTSGSLPVPWFAVVPYLNFRCCLPYILELPESGVNYLYSSHGLLLAPKVPLLCSFPKLGTTQNCRALPHSSSIRDPAPTPSPQRNMEGGSNSQD